MANDNGQKTKTNNSKQRSKMIFRSIGKLVLFLIVLFVVGYVIFTFINA